MSELKVEIMQDKSSHSLELQNSFLEARKPSFCCIGISTMCNLRCKMCFVWKNKYVKSLKEPALNEWYNFLENLSFFTENSIEVNFAGGEPLLEERNLALIDFCAKRGLFTSMPTNGFLIDKDMAYKIADSGLSTIGVSLDSFAKDTHDFLRGVEGCYDKVLRAISLLDRYCSGLKIEILTIILERNLDEIVRLTEWVNQDERIKNITFQAIAQPFNTPFNDEWHKEDGYDFIWPQDIKKVDVIIDELLRLKKEGYKITNSLSQLEVFKRYFKSPQNFIKTNKCNIDFYMNIDQFGNVHMCTRKGPVGNIKNNEAQQIWYSKDSQRIRAEIKDCRVNCHHLLNCCYEQE